MCRRVAVVAALVSAIGCSKDGKLSADAARKNVTELRDAATTDVGEIKSGLPEGAKHMAKLYADGADPAKDLAAVRTGLETARNKVQDLRVAKATFFALVDEQGTVLRTDQESDQMAGRSMLPSFPDLKKTLAGSWVETRGSMPEAAGIKGRADGQWLAATPVTVDGKTRGLYVSGWSWSSYAYRLETAARGTIKQETAAQGGAKKEPLVYVYVVVDKDVYGAPNSPDINVSTIAAQDPMSRAQGDQAWSMELEITGRQFGLAAIVVPALGARTGIAMLRSET